MMQHLEAGSSIYKHLMGEWFCLITAVMKSTGLDFCVFPVQSFVAKLLSHMYASMNTM